MINFFDFSVEAELQFNIDDAVNWSALRENCTIYHPFARFQPDGESLIGAAWQDIAELASELPSINAGCGYYKTARDLADDAFICPAPDHDFDNAEIAALVALAEQFTAKISDEFSPTCFDIYCRAVKLMRGIDMAFRCLNEPENNEDFVAVFYPAEIPEADVDAMIAELIK